jgi:hypothetical protein
MERFRVLGEYGIQQGDSVEKFYRAHSKDNAVKRFEREVRPEVGSYIWQRMMITVYPLGK